MNNKGRKINKVLFDELKIDTIGEVTTPTSLNKLKRKLFKEKHIVIGGK